MRGKAALLMPAAIRNAGTPRTSLVAKLLYIRFSELKARGFRGDLIKMLRHPDTKSQGGFVITLIAIGLASVLTCAGAYGQTPEAASAQVAPYRVYIFDESPQDYSIVYANLPQSAPGINNAGQIVGFNTAQELYPDGEKVRPIYGYIRDFTGNITTLSNRPQGESAVDGEGTAVTAISNNGITVGTVTGTADSLLHAWLKRPTSVDFTNYDVPGATTIGTVLTGVNSSGLVIGFYDGQAFYEPKQGQIKPFSCTGAISTNLAALNDSGVMVGIYKDKNEIEYGFYTSAPAYTCSTLPFLPVSISNNGQILGKIVNATGTHHVIGTLSGSYVPLNLTPPASGASFTLSGINDYGAITGTYFDPQAKQGYGNTDLFLALPINSNATVTLSPLAWQFAPHTIGQTSGPASFYLTNRGTSPALIGAITSSDFTITEDSCRYPLNPGIACKVQVVFSPTWVGDFTSTLSVFANGSVPTGTATLKGTGSGVNLTASLGYYQFPPQIVGASESKSFVIRNLGNMTAQISSIALSGQTGSYKIATNSCGGTLKGFGTCSVTVTNTAAGVAQTAASLNVISNSIGGTVIVDLNGQ
jgi:hypothetical protein